MLFHVFSLTDDATDSGKNSGNVPGREVAGSRMHVFRLKPCGARMDGTRMYQEFM